MRAQVDRFISDSLGLRRVARDAHIAFLATLRRLLGCLTRRARLTWTNHFQQVLGNQGPREGGLRRQLSTPVLARMHPWICAARKRLKNSGNPGMYVRAKYCLSN